MERCGIEVCQLKVIINLYVKGGKSMTRLIGSIKVDFTNGELRRYSINKLISLWNTHVSSHIKMGLAYDGKQHYFELVEKPISERLQRKYILKK